MVAVGAAAVFGSGVAAPARGQSGRTGMLQGPADTAIKVACTCEQFAAGERTTVACTGTRESAVLP